MSRRPSLTPEQQSAVDVDEGAFVLVAPPGSGKTEVLVRRILRLVGQSPGQAFRILALTFTTKAAEGIRTRVRAELADQEWRVNACTFHAFCLELLRSYGSSVGVTPDVTVFEDDDDRTDILLKGLVDEDYVLPETIDVADMRGLLTRIDRLRADLVAPEDAPQVRVFGSEITLREAYEAYERSLDACGAIDFNGMLLRTYQLLTSDPWASEHQRKIYRYILVDEAQDTNLAQFEVLRAVCGEELKNVFLVADADQSIFAFTGASPTYVEKFAHAFSARRLQISTNFRSASRIIEVASELATHFEKRGVRRPKMVPATGARGWVDARAYEDQAAESREVSDWIQSLLSDGLPGSWLHDGEDASLMPEDIAVLGRTRYSFDRLVDELEARGIRYLLRTEEAGLFDSLPGRFAYYAMRALANPKDVPSRRRLADLTGLNPAEVSLSDGQLTGILRELREAKDRSVRSLALALEVATGASTASEVVRLLTDVELDSDDAADAAGLLWTADRELLLRCWRDYEVRTPLRDQALAPFLISLTRLQRASIEEPGIRVLTPYRAKGLEFRVVAVLGMNEGTFPHYRSLHSAQAVDEERRSIYVAVTRAARALLLTRPRFQTTRYGNVRSQDESRFVAEMGLIMKAS